MFRSFIQKWKTIKDKVEKGIKKRFDIELRLLTEYQNRVYVGLVFKEVQKNHNLYQMFTVKEKGTL